MRGDLGRRQREDQPAAARVDAVEAQHVAQERPQALGVAAVEHRVRAGDHVSCERLAVRRELGHDLRLEARVEHDEHLAAGLDDRVGLGHEARPGRAAAPR